MAPVAMCEYVSNFVGQATNGNGARLGTIRGCHAWKMAEIGQGKADGGANQGGKWNPYGTTLFKPGATVYNTFFVNGQPVHVWNYPDFATGIEAMVETLNNGFYDELLTVMSTPGVSAQAVVNAVDASPWGTSNPQLTNQLAIYQGNRAFWNELPVGA